MAMESITLQLPEKLGRYSVDRLLGRGSMGVVLLGRDPEIERPVAIKLIQTLWQLQPADLQRHKARFFREAKLAGRLSHPRIVAVFDVGRSDEDLPYIVMEYVDGGTLKQLIECAPLDMTSVVRISCEILDALAYAHSRGVVHRDLKPSNVLLGLDQHIKMSDFGISHLSGAEFTQSDEVLGTPFYMAPEQLGRGEIDHRCDLFAFGVMLYEMLTGVKPFEGRSAIATSHSIAYDDPKPPDQLKTGIPRELSRLVLRCLDKSREKRYGSAAEVKRAMTAVFDGQTGDDVPASMAERPTKFLGSFVRTRKPIRPIFLALLLLVIAGAAMLLLMDRYGASRRTGSDADRHDGIDRAAQERLLQIAKDAFQSGRLEESESQMNELLKQSPPIEGASDLHEQIRDALLMKHLPLTVSATHTHRFGYCEGALTFETWGVQYASKQHPLWKWKFSEIRMMEMADDAHLTIQTGEREVLKLGAYKNYSFVLVGTTLRSDDWARYRAVWVKASATP